MGTFRVGTAVPRAVLTVGLLVGALVGPAGCSEDEPASSPSPSRSPSTSPTESPSTTSSSPSPAPDTLALSCQGEGSPTVVLEAGLNTSGDTFAPLASRIAKTPRVCHYDRAGIGGSLPLAASAPDPSAGSAAKALRKALEDQQVPPPYVVSGWSYGGMVAQAFAAQNPELVSGILLEDSAVPAELHEPFFSDIDWVDGGRQVDEAATTRQLRSIDFGATPLVVLTQGEAAGEFRRIWFGYADRLADLSTDALHVEAVDSGHEIHQEAEDLQLALLQELVSAVREDARLAPCDARFTGAGGRCL